ncbi:MAG: type II toxin-antitoxin system ParD family antitoxin [Rhizobiaceae bacterium]|nr:type II toxin-antitoxin system ParD family antitoxin [Rhizobiaceae bacterium]
MSRIDKQPIELSPEHLSLVEGVVESGEFGSPSAVVQAALEDWNERRQNHGYTLSELRAAIQDGIDSGSSRDGPAVMKRLAAKYQAMAVADPE